MALEVRSFHTGGDRNFGYAAVDSGTGETALIDPSPDPRPLLAYIVKEGLTVRYVFVTHGHSDHTTGGEMVLDATGRRPLTFGDRDEETGITVVHGARFPLGGIEVQVLHTPGHTDDSICLLVGDALFSGDTLFVGKVGGTDSGREAESQYRSLHDAVLSLPDDTRIFPGHDYGQSPVSTVGAERRSNPFLLSPDLDSFIDLKRNWGAYKRRHGIP